MDLQVALEMIKKAIMQLQSDAGLSTQDGIVTATIMKSLLSMDAFKLLNYGDYHGDQNIRVIQQTLNCDYSSNKYFSSDLGLIPCDGIYERKTNTALIYALQIEEGITEPTGSFGPLTREKCPYLTLGLENKFVKLLQFALYCNGPQYDPTAFTGYYGNNTQKAVLLFQNFTCLSTSGNAGMQTWSSLLTSTGDPSRKGTMCDCATTITSAKAQTLKTNGYKSVGRYLTGKFKMTQSEINTILSAGINIFPIMETGGYELSYFNSYQGNVDAKSAIKVAHDFGFDAGTIIYFTVDFDALDGDITSSILLYFSEIYQVFKRTGTTYKIGIYGPRNVCSRVAKAGLSCSSFVCDMSSGFSGNLGYPLPKDWAIDQISTITIGTGDGLIELDNNISSGKDLGVSSIKLGNNAAGVPDTVNPPINPTLYYDRNAVVAYATNPQYSSIDANDDYPVEWLNWANWSKHNRNFNKEYQRFDNYDWYLQGHFHGSDCANFISQALFAGGIKQTNDWYFKWDTIVLPPARIEKRANFSGSWVRPKEQLDYLNQNGYINGNLITLRSEKEMKEAVQKSGIQVGDLMYLSNAKEQFHHVVIITKIQNNEIYFSSHSNDRIDMKLTDTDYFSGDIFIVAKIK